MTAVHLGAMIRDSAKSFGSAPALRVKREGSWHTTSYEELVRQIDDVASALITAGIEPGDRVGICSPNRPEWTIADFAILSVGAVTVPIHATSTEKQITQIMLDAQIRVLFVGEQAQYDKVADVRELLTHLLNVISFDDNVSFDSTSDHTFTTFAAMGVADPQAPEIETRLSAARGTDIATILYTSGTTGEPKGAMLTHRAFFMQCEALDARFDVGVSDRSLCFLPLSHAYERGWTFYVLNKGAVNNYVTDPKNVAAYLPEVKPNLMVSVPRLYEKVYAGVMEQANGSAVKKRLFAWALKAGTRYQTAKDSGQSIGFAVTQQHALADRLVLSKVRDVVGGPKKVFSAGGAPLSREIEEFFYACGLLVCQGYGLTETAPMVSCNSPGQFKFGTVGRPIMGCEVRIGTDGEIQVRGDNVMLGYYNRPEDTAIAIVDGWFHTGDVGLLDADGYLKVTDRIKDLIITSQGKNIAPQRVENLIATDPYIQQVVAIGDQRKYLTALIEPSFPDLEKYAHSQGIAFTDQADLVLNPQIVDFYRNRIEVASVDLAPYERVRRFSLLPHELSEENGAMTPTLKVKRRVVESQYKHLIDAMYEV